MKLTVIRSGSQANCYVIHSKTEALVIEAGARLSEVMKVVDFNVLKINAVLVSHEHKDHSRYIEEYMARLSCDVYCSQGTIDGFPFKGSRRPKVISHGKKLIAGRFEVLPFNIQHDCNEPLGFLINHPDTGKIVFITDSYYSDYHFKNVSHFLVEANYSNHILEENIQSGKVKPFMRNRLLTSHMSIDTTKELLSANDLSQTKNIVLLHLSDQNSNARLFKEQVQGHTGKPVYIAEAGLTISLT